MNRDHSDPNAPCNPRDPVSITPAEFEQKVLQWVRACSERSTHRTHQASVEGRGGAYAIDIHVRLTLLGGANLDLLLECKHQARPVERDEIIILEGSCAIRLLTKAFSSQPLASRRVQSSTPLHME